MFGENGAFGVLALTAAEFLIELEPDIVTVLVQHMAVYLVLLMVPGTKKHRNA